MVEISIMDLYIAAKGVLVLHVGGSFCLALQVENVARISPFSFFLSFFLVGLIM